MSGLHLERLRVERMPGIRDGGFELTGLTAGVNVIHGPNASGKTTTARAIEALLWPRAAAPADALIEAAFRLEGAEWSAELAGGRTRFQREGMDAGAPALPPAEGRDRYRLSLHELLAADDAGFAQAVARESAGGYDLAAAARVLDPRVSASRCTRELAALREARARLDEARRLQATLFDEERRLRDMERELAEGPSLASRAALLDRAVEHARRAAEEAEAARETAGFDPRMERMHADDADRLRGIRARLGALRDDARAAEHAHAQAEAEAAGADLPGGGLPPDLLAALRHECESLREASRAVAAAEQAVQAWEARASAEAGAIRGVMDPERLAALDLDGIRALGEIARAGERLAARRGALDARLRDLQGDAPDALPRGVIENRVRLLVGWLGAAAPGAEDRRQRRLATVAASLLLVVGLGLVVISPVLGMVAVAGVALLLLVHRRPPKGDAREVLRAEFERSGGEGPARWDEPAVQALLDRLHAELARARLEEERAVLRAGALRELEQLEPAATAHEARRAEVARRLGVDPGTPEAGLAWLVERVGRWQGSLAELAAARAARDAALRDIGSALDAARRRIAPYAAAPIDDLWAFTGAVEALAARCDTYRRAAAARDAALRERQRVAEEERACADERHAILERLGVDGTDEPTVEAWAGALARFQAARDRHRLAAARAAEAADRVRDGAVEEGSPLLLASEPELREERERIAARLAGLEVTRDETTAIRTRIAEAKRGHEVEDALATVAECEAALGAARERDTRSAVAAALVDHLQRSTREQHLPGVFHRAREIFARVTRGRFRLDLHEDAPPAFRALDTVTGRGHPLEELSSASRIQLLMAVRLAFAETQEGPLRLPLVFDETLGNSDDARAEAIMEAVLELAAEGRQVFYLTAQPDEVGKWQAALQRRADLPWCIVDLAAARRQASRLDLAGLRVIGAARAPIPAPCGLDHAAYGALLQVARLDLHAPAGNAHLWYLVDDADALHELVSGLRVDRWGELRVLAEHGGAALVDRGVFGRTEALARALEAGLELLRVGRGRPVDRAALAASEWVSEAFLDPVEALGRRSSGDARRLLAALERGEVRRFQARAREGLREWLEENGYLDPREPLPRATIRARMVAVVAGEIGAGLVDAEAIDLLLGRVEQGVRSGAEASAPALVRADRAAAG